MIRWKGIIVLAVLAVIFFVLSWLLTDTWLEARLESLGTSINGAKVEIDNLDFSLVSVHMKWDRLQVTDPKNTMKNLIETGRTDFDLEFWPLLSEKVIIDNIQVSDIRTYTDRETDGAIPKEAKKKKSEPGFIGRTANKLSERVKETSAQRISGVKQKVNVDSIMQILNLQSVERIDSLQKSLKEKYENWDQRLGKLEIEKKAKEVERKIKSIEPEKIKKIDKLQKTLNTANEVKETVETLSEEFKSIKKDFLSDLDQARGSLDQVDNWIEADYRRARSLARLPDISAQNIGAMIFGDQIIGRFNKYLGYVGKAREYAAKVISDKPEKKDPPRLKGQDIYFFNKNARPDFWIKKINLSGETADQLRLEGLAQNIVSDQRFIGKTTEIKIQGSKESGAKAAFNATLNYLETEPAENFELNYAGFSLANTSISKSKLLPKKVKKGTGTVIAALNLHGKEINSEIKFIAANLTFDFSALEQKSSQLERMIASTIKGIDKIDVLAKVSGEQDNLDLSIKSNLDDLLMKSLRETVSKEIDKAKQQIQARIDKEVGKYRDQLNALVQGKEKELKAEMKKIEDLVKEQEQKIEDKKKEIEAQIEKEKKKLGKDAARKLKDLFK